MSNPLLEQDFDFGGYSEDSSVDMSGYIPLSKRLGKLEPNPKPTSINKKLEGSVPWILQRSSDWVPSDVRQRRRIFHRVKTGIKLALSRGLRLRWLTLTTYKDYDVSRLSKDWQVFRKLARAA